MQQIFFFLTIIILLIFIRKSVLVEPQCWEATWSNRPWGSQAPKTSNTCIWALLEGSGIEKYDKFSSLSGMLPSCSKQYVVFNYCLSNIYAYTQSISLFHNVVYILFLSNSNFDRLTLLECTCTEIIWFKYSEQIQF